MEAADAPAPVRAAALLRHLGLRPRKRWSQSFLIDSHALDSIVRAADLEPGEEVLEVGPGLGALTARLAERASRVVAVEIDPELVSALGRVIDRPNVTIVHGDILRFDPTAHVLGPYKVVANLPYNITSPTIMRFLTEVKPPTLMVVTIQQEVAERIAARAGQMSYLSVAVQLLADANIIRVIPPSAFYPPPKVHSAVLRLRVREQPRVAVNDVAAYLKLVQAGFTQPRKQLANSLAQGLGWSRAEVVDVLRRAEVDPTRRPQHLTQEDWQRISEVLGRQAD